MLGAIIGDIAGSKYEFNNVKTEDFELMGPGCDFTDDTICTVAIVDAILHGKSYAFALHEWCRRYPNPLGGYGSNFNKWIWQDEPQPYNHCWRGLGHHRCDYRLSCRSVLWNP